MRCSSTNNRGVGNPEQSTRMLAATRHRWGIILAGGDGTRLQPLTRLACGDNRPKQFCPLLGGKTLLDQTRQRISGLIEPERVQFVLTRKHEQFYKRELDGIPGFQKIIQPHNRGTLPAILWSLLRIFHADESAQVAFFPSDHYFGNEGAFTSAVERSFDFANGRRDSVVVLGAGAERPETEYCWIEPECTSKDGSCCEFSPVRRFWEKPPLETAKKLERHGCLWNTFVMIGRAGAFLEMIRHVAPVLFNTFEAALAGGDAESEERRMRLVYDDLAPSDFSREVLEQNTDRLLVTSCGEAGWSDLGEPRRFIAALIEDGAENPWTAVGACNRCGLTREQIVTLSSQGKSGTALPESVMVAPSS